MVISYIRILKKKKKKKKKHVEHIIRQKSGLDISHSKAHSVA